MIREIQQRDRLVAAVRHPRSGGACQSLRPARRDVRRAAGRGGSRPRSCCARRAILTPRIWSPACHASATRRRRRAWPARRPISPTRRPAAAFIRAVRWRWTSAGSEVPTMRTIGPAPSRRLLCRAMMAPLLELDDVSRVYTSGGLLGRTASPCGGRREFFGRRGQAGDLRDHWRVRQRQDDTRTDDPQHRAAEQGSIRFRGTSTAPWLAPARRGWHFMRQVQPIFQNPFEAFNPLKRVDRYLFMTARRFATGDAGAACGRQRIAPGRLVAGRSAATLSRTNCRAASCSASPSPAR